MSRLDDKYKHIIKNAENRKMLKIALTVVSLAVVFVVFAVLTRPGITMTSDNADGGTQANVSEGTTADSSDGDTSASENGAAKAAYSIGENGAISKDGGQFLLCLQVRRRM